MKKKRRNKISLAVRMFSGIQECGACKEIKALNAFNIASETFTGRHAWCRDCQKMRYQCNKAQHNELTQRRYRERGKSERQANQAALTEKMRQRRKDPKKYKRMRDLAKQRYHENPEVKAYAILSAQMRKRGVEQATPAHADIDAIKAIYNEAREINAKAPNSVHVDHIIPLKHPLVCGLHVAENLRIIPAKENLQKSNAFTV